MVEVVEALNVRVVGNGKAYVVLAHGFGSDQSVWRRILPCLLPNYKVVLFDMPFSGNVNPDFFDFSRYATLDGYVDDLLVILDSLGVTTCCYIGHSISAMIGMLASIRRPSLFSRLVFMGSTPRFIYEKWSFEGGFRMRQIMKLFISMESNYRSWVNHFAVLVAGKKNPEAVAEYRQTLHNIRPDIVHFVCKSVYNYDFRVAIRLVRTRVFIIHTYKDFFAPLEVPLYLKAHLGGSTDIIFIYAKSHLPHLTVPTETGLALIRALTQR